jgi:hypothetical protein
MSWISSIRTTPSPRQRNTPVLVMYGFTTRAEASMVVDVFSQEDIVSGMINLLGHLLVCV